MPRRPNRSRSAAHNYAAKLLDGLLHDDASIRELYWDLWDRMTPAERDKWDRLALSKVVRELTADEADWVSDMTDKYAGE